MIGDSKYNISSEIIPRISRWYEKKKMEDSYNRESDAYMPHS